MRTIPEPPDFEQIRSQRGSELLDATSDERYRKAYWRCQKPYRHWHKVRYIAREEGVDPEILWAYLKFSRQSNQRRLPFKDKYGQALRFNLTDELLREQSACDQQLAGIIGFGDGHALSIDKRDRFILGSLMEEAIASSKLEGASTVHRVAKEMLRRKREPRNRSEWMIHNNFRAIMFVRDHVDLPLTPELLMELQRLLTMHTIDIDKCGRLRTEDEDIAVVDMYDEEVHVPPHASELPGRLTLICDFANRPTEDFTPFLHPLVRAMALHFQLAYDHPFCDGNGRTARTLFYWSMLRSGYWLMEFLPISRLIYRAPSQYGRVFQYVETDGFDLTYFLEYHARIIRLARTDLRKYLERKQRESRAARSAFASAELNDRQRKLLMHALDHPVFEYTIESHRAIHGISYQTAREDLLNLETLGYLNRRKVGKKFIFEPTSTVRHQVDESSG